jgi:predicted nucleic-acid-binding protein
VIAIDTNVLLRRLLQDDPEQSKQTNRLFEKEELILITDVVLAETIWTLKGKRCGIDKTGIVSVVTSLLEEPNVLFENTQAVWSALNDFINAKPVETLSGVKSADFADALIVNKSKEIAKLQSGTIKAVYTFDQGALELPGTKSPK